MYRQKSLIGLGALAITLCVEILMTLAVSSVQAQGITFPPTQPRGAPARTVGGGQRGGGSSCANSSLPLTALTPSNNVVTTVSANPTLFWYVPKTEAKSAEFVVLERESLKEVYKTTVALKGVPGIVKLKMPPSVSLSTNKKYLWKFSLICDSADQPEERFVAGYIERTELDLEAKKQLATTTEPLKKAEVYANAMIWQETLSLLAQLLLDRPNDPSVTVAWREVLTSVKLEAIATQPLVECCNAATPME